MVIAFSLMRPLRAPAMIANPMKSSTIGMMLRTAHWTIPSELIPGDAAALMSRDTVTHLRLVDRGAAPVAASSIRVGLLGLIARHDAAPAWQARRAVTECSARDLDAARCRRGRTCT